MRMTGVGEAQEADGTILLSSSSRGLGVSAQRLTSGRSPVFRSDAFRPRTEQREVLRSKGNSRAPDAFNSRRLPCTDAVDMDSESASDARERFGEIASQYEQGASRKWEFTQILHLLTSVSLLPPFHLRLDVPPMYLLSINLNSYATGKRYANRKSCIWPGTCLRPERGCEGIGISRMLIAVSRRYRSTLHQACALIY